MRRKPLYTLPPPRYCRAYLRYTTALSQPRYVLKSARILEKCFASLHSTPATLLPCLLMACFATALSQPRYVLKSARILEKCFASLHSTPRHATTVLTYDALCHCLKSTPLRSKKVLAF